MKAWEPLDLLSGAVHLSYLMLFSSLYAQLPGLHGPQGIDPHTAAWMPAVARGFLVKCAHIASRSRLWVGSSGGGLVCVIDLISWHRSTQMH